MLSKKRERMDSMGYDGSLKFDTEINEKGFNSGLSKMGSLAQTALGVFSGQMMTRAVDGIANLGKSALEAVSSMEQNIGVWKRCLKTVHKP